MDGCTCPYCDKEVEVTHDDGAGYAEDVTHQQECPYCLMSFVFTTGIIYVYHTEKAPCLNGEVHLYKPTITYPKKYSKMQCVYCGEKRKPTLDELAQIMRLP